MPSLREIREALVAASRRHSRVGHEAEDLAHDVLVSALRRGLVLDGEVFTRSARRAAQLHGAFLARSAGRRRARELRVATPEFEHGGGEPWSPALSGSQPSTLSPALETTLQLLVLGLDKAELRSVLGLSDAALRKRFQALRGHRPPRPTITVACGGPTYAGLRRSQIKLLPRLAERLVREQRARRVVAASDPDGHGLIFTEVLTPERGTATAGGRAPDPGPPKEGRPCSTANCKTSQSSSS